MLSNIGRRRKLGTSYRWHSVVLNRCFSWALKRNIVQIFSFSVSYNLMFYLWCHTSSLVTCCLVASTLSYKWYEVIRPPNTATARTSFCWKLIFVTWPENDYSSITWNWYVRWFVHWIHDFHLSPVINIWIYTLHLTLQNIGEGDNFVESRKTIIVTSSSNCCAKRTN